MADLLTTQTLARWTQSDPTEVAADPFALDLIDKLSQLLCFLGGHPDWTLDPGPDRVPVDVEMVMLQVAKRSYENPEQIIQEGNVGPIGGDRHIEAYALFMELTDEERATVTKYNPDGDPNGDGDNNGEVFVVQTTRGEETSMPHTPVLYMGDDQQINLATSADPREWKINLATSADPREWKMLLFSPGDPGDPNNYE